MTSISATKARSSLFDLIKNVLKRHEPLRISHKDGDVVVLSEEDYESLMETLDLLSSPNFRKKHRQSKKQIKDGQTFSMSDVFGD